jgi:hypothetical protein
LKKKHSFGGVLAGSIFSLVMFGLAAFLILNRQYIYDQWNVWHYQPSSSVNTISERAGLSDKGKFYLAASDTVVEDASQFNNDCVRQEAKNPILGCYTNLHIYIYGVTNSELDGIEEVTAAHEMLHAAWDRLSDSEKTRIGNMLDAEYAKIATPELKARMDYYNRNETGERQNELHSILGTEFGNLTPELESYYSQYFLDRQKVVTLHDRYESIFTQLMTQADTLYNQLTTLGKKITGESAAYNKDAATLSTDIQDFNNRAKAGGFTSTTQFNSERAALLARTTALEAERTSLNAEISSYNDMYAKYQALTVRTQQLNNSIDSTVAPAPSL